jgi:hypothetical protein
MSALQPLPICARLQADQGAAKRKCTALSQHLVSGAQRTPAAGSVAAPAGAAKGAGSINRQAVAVPQLPDTLLHGNEPEAVGAYLKDFVVHTRDAPGAGAAKPFEEVPPVRLIRMSIVLAAQ